MTTRQPEDRLMTLSEVASYLHVGKRTALKLAVAKRLPGLMLENEWRFRRSDVDEWLAHQLEGDTEDFEEVTDGMKVPLGDLMPLEAVMHDLRATDALGVIEELAAHAYAQKWLNDKPWFIGALVERESLASTAMEGGVAFLHTRSRDTERIRRPFVICGRSYHGIEFGASDGRPTFLFFLLGLKYDKLHLPILGRMARMMMRNPTVVQRLRAAMSPIKIRDMLLKLDAQELAATSVPAVALRQASNNSLDRKERLRTIMRVSARKKYEAKKAAEAEDKARKRASRLSARKAAGASKKAAAAKASAKKSKAAVAKASASKSKSKPAAAKATAKKPKTTAAKATAKKSKSAVAKASVKKSRTAAKSSAKSKSTRTRSKR